VVELAEAAYRGLAPRYADLRAEASRVARDYLADPSALRAAKAYTETVLTPLLMASPMVARAYEKPLGYPGDYQVMLYYYDDAFAGDTAFAKAFHKLFVNHPLSAGVCTRRDYVAGWLARELERTQLADSSEEYAIASLGCGPAKEIGAFVAASPRWARPMRWRLIDQEPRTLQVAYEGAQRALATTPSPASVECLNVSFSQILRTPALLASGKRQNFIFCTGLFDYLATNPARQLLAALYDCLAPGGMLLVGNAKGPNDYFFCPELVLDWNLIYRDLDEMRALTAGLPEHTEIEIEPEPSGAYWFLRSRRPLA
jgi:hypothetical protein